MPLSYNEEQQILFLVSKYIKKYNLRAIDGEDLWNDCNVQCAIELAADIVDALGNRKTRRGFV